VALTAVKGGEQVTQGEDVKQQQGKDEDGEITSAQPAE
jgi:hypothetical protein